MYNVYLCFSDRGNRKYSRRYAAMYDHDDEHRHENQPTLTNIIRPTHSQTPAVPPSTRPSAGILYTLT